MARHESLRKLKLDDDQPDQELIKHVAALGLKTVDDYVAWCERHGFSRRTAKNWHQRVKETAFAHQEAAQARLRQKKHELRSPQKAIEGIFDGSLKKMDVTQPHLREICRAYEASTSCRRTKRALLELLLHVGKCSELLAVHPVIPQFGHMPGNTFIGGLLALARFSQNWIRPLADWKPTTHNSRRQFSSLARHLLAEWPVPAFMDSVWFKDKSGHAAQQQGWFLHIGSGHNIRTADLPLNYTKRMAHHFMQAPADLTVEAALRWGQIHGLGGDARLTKAVIGSRLGESFSEDEFWTSVLNFFIANPMLDTAHVGPIIDYIHNQRFVSHEVFVAPGVLEERSPPEPNFTMKGRTAESLLKKVEAWHKTLAKTQQPQAEWLPSGIERFEFVEGSEKSGNVKLWTITELLSTKALYAEGRAMKHCVGSYSQSCARGRSSIWSMEVETFEGRSKIMTVEVNNSAKLICQARGKHNAPPGDKHRGILRRWAEKARLTLANYV